MTSAALTPIDIEAAIVARLKGTLLADGAIKRVYDTAEYSGVPEESQAVPAIAVIYNGYRPGGQRGDGVVQAVFVQFLVVVVTRSSTQALRRTGAKQDASVIFDAAVRKLIGWKPAKGLKRLTLIDGPGAGYSDAGFTYLPIGFETRITYTHEQ